MNRRFHDLKSQIAGWSSVTDRRYRFLRNEAIRSGGISSESKVQRFRKLRNEPISAFATFSPSRKTNSKPKTV